MHWPGMPVDPQAEPRLRDVIGVRFGPSQLHRLDDLAKLLPADVRAQTLRRLVAALYDALEDAVEYERPGAPSSDVGSVARHEQDRYPSGFYPIVRAVTDVWELLAAEDPVAAGALADPWRTSDQLLLRRMWLHTLSAPMRSGAVLDETVPTITDEDFWTNQARREVMLLLAVRWDDLSPTARAATEARIVGGIPEALLEMGEGEQRRAYVDHEVFKRLERICGAGHELSRHAMEALTDIRSRHPQWQAGEGDRDDFGIWSTGVMVTTGPQGDPEMLEGVTREDLVARAAEAAAADPMRQGEIWRTLCDSAPLRAMDALLAGLDAGRCEPDE